EDRCNEKRTQRKRDALGKDRLIPLRHLNAKREEEDYSRTYARQDAVYHAVSDSERERAPAENADDCLRNYPMAVALDQGIQQRHGPQPAAVGMAEQIHVRVARTVRPANWRCPDDSPKPHRRDNNAGDADIAVEKADPMPCFA